jgi:hypothetical protein
LLVRQDRSTLPWPSAERAELAKLAGEETWHVGSVPERLRPVAMALCEPLLLGGQLPATYAEIARRTGLASIKKVRLLVADLCHLYASQTPALQERIVRRLQREQAELRLPTEPTLRAGVWQFQRQGAAADQSGDVRRRRALALPDYYEVAHLLVRRRLITVGDLGLLPSPGPATLDDLPGPQ